MSNGVGTTEIPFVRKDETFKTWRERTNQMIQQQNNFVRLQELEMLGIADPYVTTSMQLNYLVEVQSE
jgi:hypothetical protein|tara:strand:+ start:7804 stop:8007 length:204 start_codon:yes stop_codon:yes gene_type:complete